MNKESPKSGMYVDSRTDEERQRDAELQKKVVYTNTTDGSVRCCDNGDMDEKHDCLHHSPKTIDDVVREFEKGNYTFFFRYIDKDGNEQTEKGHINDSVPHDVAYDMLRKHVREYGESRIIWFFENEDIQEVLRSTLSTLLHTAIAEIEAGMNISCDDFHHLPKGQPWTPCSLCGLRRDERPKKTGEMFYADGFNAGLSEATAILRKLLGEEKKGV